MLEKGQESIFQTVLEDLQRQVLKPWFWLTIFQGGATSFGDNSSGRSVDQLQGLLENLGGDLESDNEGTWNLMNIGGAWMPVVDIWSGTTLIGIDSVSEAENYGDRKG